jgi:hypothetical protein
LDPDRAPKFRQVLQQLGVEGEMADLDDEPAQVGLPIEQVQETIVQLLAGKSYSLILTGCATQKWQLAGIPFFVSCF